MVCYIGQWVIDTKKKITPTVCGEIPDTTPTLYVLEDEDGDYYIQSENYLIEYDKYWFDE